MGAAPASDAFEGYNAFLSYDPGAAGVHGPLADIALAVKDNIAVAGAPFTAGMPLFAQRIAAVDALAVSTLRAAGARVVGVTRTDAGGFGVTTPEVRNPILPERIAGGSSGGAAAAVSAGHADLGLGTDTAGSVRIPAACCGIVGFKPSHGLIPMDGVWPLAPEFDTVGFMAPTLEPIRRAGALWIGATGPLPEKLLFGIDKVRLAGCEPCVADAFREALLLLADRGVMTCEVALPDRHLIAEALGTKILASAQRVYADLDSLQRSELPRPAARALAAADLLADEDLRSAEAILDTVHRDFISITAAIPVVIMPTLPIEIPRRDTRQAVLDGQPVPLLTALTAETRLANAVGGPALSLPFWSRAGVLIGIQLMARAGSDAELIGAGMAIEAMLRSGLGPQQSIPARSCPR